MKEENKKLERSLSNFFRSAFDILNKPQLTLRRIRNHLEGKYHIFDKASFEERLSVKAWSPSRKLKYEYDNISKQMKVTPLSEEEIKELERRKDEVDG